MVWIRVVWIKLWYGLDWPGLGCSLD